MDAGSVTMICTLVSGAFGAFFKFSVFDRIKLLEGKIQAMEEELATDRAVLAFHHSFRLTVASLARQQPQVPSAAILELDTQLESQLEVLINKNQNKRKEAP
ncbi:MAG: hypothetical protein RL095_1749 [Verrucomicrobiota bacterium]|jgi:hypothetical protein